MISLTERYKGISGEQFARLLLEGIEDPTKRSMGSIRLLEHPKPKIPDDLWEQLFLGLRGIDDREHSNYRNSPFILNYAHLGYLNAGESGGLGRFYFPYLQAQRLKARKANLDRAYLPYANLEGVKGGNERTTTDLRSLSLVRADVSHASLRYAWLNDAEVCATNFVGADLDGANVNGVKFYEAILVDPKDKTKTVKNLDKTIGLGQAVFWRGPPYYPGKLKVTRDLRDIIVQARQVSDKKAFVLVD